MKKIGFFSLAIVVAFSFAVLLTGCQTVNSAVKDDKFCLENEILPLEDLCPDEIFWEEMENGIMTTGESVEKAKVIWKAVRIDLDVQEIEIVIAPEKDESKSFRLRDFAVKNDLLVAVNTTPFISSRSGKTVGIIKNNGKILSTAVEKYGALGFYTNKDGFLRAEILESQKENLISEFDSVIGGFFMNLKDGEILEFAKIRNARCGCGTSDDGRFLYLFAAENRLGNKKSGLNYEECAAIMKKLGCYDALQFDGGSSTGLVTGEVDAIRPVFQRKVPAAFGFRKAGVADGV